MGFLKNNFFPNFYLKDLFQLRADDLRRLGFEAILSDLDNTLLPWNEPFPTKEAKTWVSQLNEGGIELLILSNNKDDRVKLVAHELGVKYISKARKPFKRKKVEKLLEAHHLDKQKVLFIGDQLLTDVFFARRLKTKSLLVEPIIKTDSRISSLNRQVEKALFFWFSHHL